MGTAIFRLIFKKIKIRHFYAKCLIFIMRFYEFLCNSLEFTCFSSFFNVSLKVRVYAVCLVCL
nr:MAG TPA: hypothetical protein [Caudoviricetes sp.]